MYVLFFVFTRERERGDGGDQRVGYHSKAKGQRSSQTGGRQFVPYFLS